MLPFDLLMKLREARVLNHVDLPLDFLLPDILSLLLFLLFKHHLLDACIFENPEFFLFGGKRAHQHARQLFFAGPIKCLFGTPTFFIDSYHVIASLILSLLVKSLLILKLFFFLLLRDGYFLG